MNATAIQHVSLLTPSAAPLNPRGARIAARLFVRLYRAIRQAFPASTPAPAGATVTARAVEAREVRAMAWKVERSDPGLAADLYAAAARHEGLPA